MAKVGDKLHFKKFTWTITKVERHWYSGCESYKYRVHRKYFKIGEKYLLPLTNTNCTYTIMPWRWNFLRKQLKKNPEYHYNMSLWSNAPR